MKRIILIALLSFLAKTGYSQLTTLLGLYGGAGSSTTLNYNVGISGGLNFEKQIGGRTCLGATLFYQGYNFYYDREDHYVNNGGGDAGVTILNKSGYIFVAPKISQFFGKHNALEAFVNVGAGFKMSGTETMRKWDYGHGTGTGTDNYDSVINTTKNINSMVLRFGVGLTEYLHLNNNWWFSITEDCGFLASTLSKTSDVNDPSRTAYSPNGKLNPNYFSLQIGISHARYK